MILSILGGKPTVEIRPEDPLAPEILEHWAAKLTLRGKPTDIPIAQEAQRAAELVREYRKTHGGL